MSGNGKKPKEQGKRSAVNARDAYLYNWEGLRAFLDVARVRSISQAAASLDLQHTTLSRRIAALEREIGRPLIRRSARGIQLTPDGLELLGVLVRFDEDLGVVGRWITRGVKDDERPIHVNIACTEGLSAYWLTQFLPVLRRRNSRACYNIHTSLSTTPERERTFHASIQMQQPANAGTAEQIGFVHFAAMASETYIDDVGAYRPGDNPRHHRWIEHAPFRVMSGSWETWFQRKKIDVPPFVVTNSLVTTVNAVRSGAGIGLLPTYMAVNTPNLVPLDAGLRLRFPIWLSTDAPAGDSPELSAALGLIRAAIDPAAMPWFREKHELKPDYDAWRSALKMCVDRLA